MSSAPFVRPSSYRLRRTPLELRVWHGPADRIRAYAASITQPTSVISWSASTAIWTASGRARLKVGAALATVEKAILAGLVANTTAALLRDREAQKESLTKRLQGLDEQRLKGPLRVDERVIEVQIGKLDEVLRPDAKAANAFFREHLKIRCMPAERGGRRFYQAFRLCG